MIQLLNEYSGTDLIVVGLSLLLVLIISLSMHELAHAFVAYKQGDQTPKAQGRLTFNPLKHMDPIGFICFMLFGFGWAKPVEINPLKFRKYKRGLFLTSVAGVVVNIILAFFSCGLFYLSLYLYANFIPNMFGFVLVVFFELMFTVNITLFVFNLLPIYPLDGFSAISAYAKYDNKFVQFMRQWGSYLLIIIVVALSDYLMYLIEWVMWPIAQFWGLFL